MTNPKVSIIIPTYNHAVFLRDCLQSIIDQTMQDWEAIVVNNFSTDDTEAIVAATNDPRIRILNFSNDGVIGASRNRGNAEAAGEWLAFLDSDDKWRPCKLANCFEAIDGATDVMGHGLAFVRDGQVIHHQGSGPETRATLREMLFQGGCLTPSAALVRKSLFDKLGGFSEDPAHQTAEDYELWLKLAFHGASFKFIDDILVDYRVHENQASNKSLIHMRAGIAILDKYYKVLDRRTLIDWMRYRNRIASVYHGAAKNCHFAHRHLKAYSLLAHCLFVWPFYIKAIVDGLSGFARMRKK